MPGTFSPAPRRADRIGLTLIEILISVTLTLILVFALVRVFQMLGDDVRVSRAILEMSGQLRTVSHQLQEDLDNLTVTVRPFADSDGAPGSFEVVEGIATDRDVDGDGITYPDTVDDAIAHTNADVLNRADVDYHQVFDGAGAPVLENGLPHYAMTSKGDRDDVLLFTVRTSGKPYVGQLRGDLGFNTTTGRWVLNYQPNGVVHTIESREAEVVWWSEPDDKGIFRVYRRAILVRPDIDILLNANSQVPAVGPPLAAWMRDFVRHNDFSVHFRLAANAVIANSLADLTRRENRYAHVGQFGPEVQELFHPSLSADNDGFPYPIHMQRLRINYMQLNDPTNQSLVSPLRLTEYLALADTLAFDVRAYDPTASLQPMGGNTALAPSDPGYTLTTATPAQGAYVDLNYAANGLSQFSDRPTIRSGLSPTSSNPTVAAAWTDPVSGQLLVRGVYDTFPRHYERDGQLQVNGQWVKFVQGSTPPPDRGSNGIDDDNINGVDDSGEFDTSPPYVTTLRGIEVTIRSFEFNTRQVRQVRVVGDLTQGAGS